MTLQLTALLAVAVLLTWATLAGRQSWLLIAVLAYVTAVIWIIQCEMNLLFLALGIAIVIGGTGVVRVLRRDTASPDDTTQHNESKVVTNNVAHLNNIEQSSY
jgi:hypothetical protein